MYMYVRTIVQGSIAFLMCDHKAYVPLFKNCNKREVVVCIKELGPQQSPEDKQYAATAPVMA